MFGMLTYLTKVRTLMGWAMVFKTKRRAITGYRITTLR